MSSLAAGDKQVPQPRQFNHRLVSWRVVDGSGGVLDYKGASASAMLAYLAGGNSWHEDDDEDGSDLETAPQGLSDVYDLIVGLAPAPDGQEDANDIATADSDAIEE